MAVIGSAYVVVRALTDKLQADVSKAITKAAAGSRGSGASIGDNLTAGFKDKVEGNLGSTLAAELADIDGSGIGQKIGMDMAGAYQEAARRNVNPSLVLNERELASVGSRVGSVSGSSFGTSFGQSAGESTDSEVDSVLAGILQATADAGDSAGSAYAERRNAAVANAPPPPPPGGGGGGGGGGDSENEAAGERAGRSYNRGFGKGLSGIGDSLFKIITRVAFLGTIVSVAVGGISALVSGLFAMASAAGTAASALVVLPSLLGALAQGALGAVLAFGGIGAAVKAGTAAQVSGGQQAEASARQQVLAARAVRDANQRLADTIEENAQRMKDAHDSVREARERLSDAEKDAADAQEDIGTAREAAAERLQQLGFAVRQAAIDEREATKALADAQRGYAEALLQPIPFDPDMTEEERLQITLAARAKAQDSLEQAQLTAERAADRSSDLQREQAEETAKGIEGSDEVVRAKEREVEATERVEEAEQSLAEARANIKETEKSNARAIRDARQSVTDAIYNQKTAQDAGTTSANAFGAAMQKLSPEAQRFVTFLIGLRPEIEKLRAAAGRQLFPKLEIAIQNLVDNFFPALRKSLEDTGSALGDASISISDAIVRMTKDGDFSKISDTNTTSLRRLGDVAGSLIGAFGSILAAASPLINKFTKFLKVQANIFEAWADSKQKSGELTEGFNKAGIRAGQLGRIVANIVKGFFRLGQVASESGGDLLKSFEDATERFAHMFDSNARADEVGDQFATIADNVKAIGRLAVTVGGVLFRLGANPAIADIADKLGETTKTLEPLLNTLIEKFGPRLTELFDTIVAIFGEMAEAGGFEIALGIFQDFADVLLVIVKTDAAKYLLATLAAFKALRAVGKFTGITGLVSAIGDPKKLKGLKAFATGLSGGTTEAKGFLGATTRLGGKLRGFVPGLAAAGPAAEGAAGAVGGLGATLAGIAGPILIVVGVIAAIAAGFILLYKKNKAFHDFVDKVLLPMLKDLGNFFKDVFGQALEKIGDIIETKVLPALSAFGDFLNDFVLVPWIAFVTFMIRRVFPVLGTIIKFIARLVGTYFKGWVAAIKLVVKVFSTLVTTAIRVVRRVIGVFGDIIDFFHDLPGNIANIAGNVWDFLTDAADNVLDLISDFIDDIVNLVKGLPRALFNAGKTAWNWWDDLIDDAVAKIADLVSGAVDIVRGLPAKLLNAGKNAWDWWDDLVDNAVASVKTKIGNLITWVRGVPAKLASAGAKAWDFFTDQWDDMRTAIGTKATALVEYVKGLPGRFVAGIRNIWGFISDQWTTMREALNTKIAALILKIRGLPAAFSSGVGNLWGFITAGLSGMLNGALHLVNGAIDKINGLIKKLNGLPGIEIRYIPNIGYVAESKEPTTTRGPGGKPLPLASGGTIKAFPGGTLALLGESQQSERVTPLDSSGLSSGDRAVLAAIKELASAQGGQVYAPNITVHGQETPRRTAQEILLEQRRAVLSSNFIWNS